MNNLLAGKTVFRKYIILTSVYNFDKCCWRKQTMNDMQHACMRTTLNISMIITLFKCRCVYISEWEFSCVSHLYGVPCFRKIIIYYDVTCAKVSTKGIIFSILNHSAVCKFRSETPSCLWQSSWRGTLYCVGLESLGILNHLR